MDRRTVQPSSQDSETKEYSAEWFVLLYSLGALAGLLCAFHPSLTALQTTNCLVLSWLLALGALVVSLLSDRQEEEEQGLDDF